MKEMKTSPEDFQGLAPGPVTFSSSSTKRAFVSLGRKGRDGSQSVLSTGSSSTHRSAEAAAVRKPSKSRIRRHANRLSGVFLRSPANSSGSMALNIGQRSSQSVQPRKGSMVSAETLLMDDPSELSNHITAPGILKIFGNEICEGAHYKSVLATTHSSAKELVKEALERYGLSKQEAESYVLCDTIGSIDNHQWKTEGIRLVGDHEKPLLLQSLWKPREGFVRRFEIQRRSLLQEKISKEKDTVTAGINAQARKLQKSRSRVTSTLLQRTTSRNQKLWRSKSEMDLLSDEGKRDREHDVCAEDQKGSLNHASVKSCKSPRRSPEQSHIHSMAPPLAGGGGSEGETETLCVSRQRGEREEEESEREETESSDDNTTVYSIHPPQDCPYLLLLQGWSLVQDFIIYLLPAPHAVAGQRGSHEDRTKVDIPLSAGDVRPKHCCFHRHSVGGPVVLCPHQDAVVTRNGEAVRNPVQLSPGDVIGLGKHYLFLFRDPSNLMQKEFNGAGPEAILSAAPPLIHPSCSAAATNDTETILCSSCTSNCTDFQSSDCKQPLNRGPPPLKSAGGHSLTLDYQAEDEAQVVKEIISMGRSSSVDDRPPLTVSFLLSSCVQYSAACLHPSDLRRLLLLIASGAQRAMWECTTDLAVQSDIQMSKGLNPEDHQADSLHKLISGLRPLVVWMANSLELLQFIQHQLPLILKWRSLKEQGKGVEEEEEDDEGTEEENMAQVELSPSGVCSAREETMAVLEEVMMLAFQQYIFYLTKFLYPILPGLLDCNPFRANPDPWLSGDCWVPASRGPQVPEEIQQVMDVLKGSWRLLLDCQVHPKISSQLIGYLFYFINASLFNSLMERGSEPGFYQWSRGVQMRSSLDLVLDWAHSAGLGALALEHTQTLSSAISLLTTPQKNLLQTSWVSLRSDYPALSPAQLHHLLSLYSPEPAQGHTWTPSAQDQRAASTTADILESFDTHHPLVLPDEGYQLQLGGAGTDSALREQMHKLKLFISTLSGTEKHQDELSCDNAQTVTQKLRTLNLLTEDTETSELKRAASDPPCLLAPPDPPLMIDPPEPLKTDGGLVLECLAALTADHLKSGCSSVKTLVELKEEEEEEGAEEEGMDDGDEEVFSLELERGERGLGLALVDTRDTSSKVKGVFIHAVVPDSPAARCEKLEPGDRILAVNGVSLLGLDYESGKKLIQSSGTRLRLLVARSHFMAAAIQTEC